MPEVDTKKSKRIFLLLRVTIIACGLLLGVFWVSREQRWSRLVQIFHQMNMVVFACVLGVFIVSQLIIGLRWWLLLRTQSVFIGFWAAVRLYFLGWFYNNFMPGSVGGDFLRAWYVAKYTHKRFEAVLSVFVDRLIGLLSTLVIAVFCYCLFLWGKTLVVTSSGQGGLLASLASYRRAVLFTLAAIALVFCTLLLTRTGRNMLRKAFSSICVQGLKLIEKLKSAAVLYCRKPLVILLAFGLTVFLQILTITGFWFLGVSLGIEASIKYYYVFFTLTWVLGAVPVSIAGAVVVESMLAYLFIKFAAVQPEPALALALCQRIVWMLASLPGAVIHLAGAHLPKDFSQT